MTTKRPIMTLEDALAALERKRKEITRLLNQIAGYKELVASLTRRIQELEKKLATYQQQQ